MAQALPAISTAPVVPASKWTLHYAAGVFWLVYFLTNSSVWINDLAPFPSYYPLIGTYLLYLALTSPVQVFEFITKPITWLWALTALVPLALFYFGSSHNSYAWGSATIRVTYFSVLAGTGVLLLHPDGFRILKTAAKISLAFAVVTILLDLVVYNPYNSAEGGGRTAGFYGDANLAAAAIGTLLLLSVDFSRQNLKSMLIVGISLLAIISTQSRSGIIFAFLLSAAYIFLPRGRDTFSGGTRTTLAVSGLFLLIITVVIAGQILDIDSSQAWRIRSLLTLDISDISSQGRIYSAEDALDGFLSAFWTGLGLGALPAYAYSPHNAYLAVALEYGVGGLVLYFVVIIHALSKVFRFGIRRALTNLLLTFQFAYYSLFSHTVQTNTIFAVFFAAVIVNATISEPEENSSETRVV